jgi:hypothetical protein
MSGIVPSGTELAGCEIDRNAGSNMSPGINKIGSELDLKRLRPNSENAVIQSDLLATGRRDFEGTNLL